MEAYLKRYCTYLSKLKSGVNISETIDFIRNDSYATIEIIDQYKREFNVEKLCSLLKDAKFLVNYEYDEKVKIHFKLFYNLYTYAKNLIRNFDIYSCKTIKPSSVIMRDCIMLFPHHRQYMEGLLGYKYDVEKSEWSMPLSRNDTIRNRLAAVCILTAIGHSRIEEIVNERCSSSSGDSSGTSMSEDFGDQVNSSSQKWSCPHCTLLNYSNQTNCSACSKDRRLSVHVVIKRKNSGAARRQPDVTDGRERNNRDRWKCQYCENHNESKEEKCKICEAGRHQLRDVKKEIRGAEKLKVRESTRENGRREVVRREDAGRDDGWREDGGREDRNEGGGREVTRRTMHEVKLRPRVPTWECSKCTMVNEGSWATCQTCFTGRLKRASSQVQMDSGRAPGQDQWRCEKCTFINEGGRVTCEACSGGRLVRATSTVEMKVSDAGAPKWRCGRCSCVNTVGKAACVACGLLREAHEAGHRSRAVPSLKVSPLKTPPPVTQSSWPCPQCSLLNDTRIVNCQGCYAARLQGGPLPKTNSAVLRVSVSPEGAVPKSKPGVVVNPVRVSANSGGVVERGPGGALSNPRVHKAKVPAAKPPEKVQPGKDRVSKSVKQPKKWRFNLSCFKAEHG